MNSNQQIPSQSYQQPLMPYYYHLYYQQMNNPQIPLLRFPPPPPISKPSDPRIRNNNLINKKQEQQQKKKQPLKVNKTIKQKEKIIKQSSSSDDDSEQIMQRRKPIQKDPILDSADQIRKWVEARRMNYPSKNKINGIVPLKQEMSILETKIRKKIQIVNSDPKAIFKKLKNMDVLKRIILTSHSHKIKKKPKKTPPVVRYFEKSILASEINDNSNEIIEPEEIPIPTKQLQQVIDPLTTAHRELMPQQIISHLQKKQKEDKEWAECLLRYKSNSLNYKYTCGTLEASLSLQDLFKESSYLIQAIRYIVKNDFFSQQQQQKDI